MIIKLRFVKHLGNILIAAGMAASLNGFVMAQDIPAMPGIINPALPGIISCLQLEAEMADVDTKLDFASQQFLMYSAQLPNQEAVILYLKAKLKSLEDQVMAANMLFPRDDLKIQQLCDQIRTFKGDLEAKTATYFRTKALAEFMRREAEILTGRLDLLNVVWGRNGCS